MLAVNMADAGVLKKYAFTKSTKLWFCYIRQTTCILFKNVPVFVHSNEMAVKFMKFSLRSLLKLQKSLKAIQNTERKCCSNMIRVVGHVTRFEPYQKKQHCIKSHNWIFDLDSKISLNITILYLHLITSIKEMNCSVQCLRVIQSGTSMVFQFSGTHSSFPVYAISSKVNIFLKIRQADFFPRSKVYSFYQMQNMSFQFSLLEKYLVSSTKIFPLLYGWDQWLLDVPGFMLRSFVVKTVAYNTLILRTSCAHSNYIKVFDGPGSLSAAIQAHRIDNDFCMFAATSFQVTLHLELKNTTVDTVAFKEHQRYNSTECHNVTPEDNKNFSFVSSFLQRFIKIQCVKMNSITHSLRVYIENSTYFGPPMENCSFAGIAIDESNDTNTPYHTLNCKSYHPGFKFRSVFGKRNNVIITVYAYPEYQSYILVDVVVTTTSCQFITVFACTSTFVSSVNVGIALDSLKIKTVSPTWVTLQYKVNENTCVILQLTSLHNKKESITSQASRICRLSIKHFLVQEAKLFHYYAVCALFPGMLVQCLDDTCAMYVFSVW